MLKRAGPDGMSKVVNEFTANHPEISKRQTELKVFEVAVKEKQADDTKQVCSRICCPFKLFYFITSNFWREKRGFCGEKLSWYRLYSFLSFF